jgi:tRNA pseudouridine55 synthase
LKRGQTGLSFVLGVDKPLGMSSHDVVGRCRRIFGEGRIGHAGTLDPAASGVLIVCVGSAARLDKYLTCHDKTYLVDVAFGASTTTDDAQGEVLSTCIPADELLDSSFANIYLSLFTGKQKQVPPVYSAIKVAGVKAYDAARKGSALELESREVEIYNIELIRITDMRQISTHYIVWTVSLHVSKGTYIRSFARDLGNSVGCPAHVLHLDRRSSGSVSSSDCVSLEALEQYWNDGLHNTVGKAIPEEFSEHCILDPLVLLEYKYAFVDEKQQSKIQNGCKFSANDLQLCYPLHEHDGAGCDCCTHFAQVCEDAPTDGELICLCTGHELFAIYKFEETRQCWVPDCVLNPPVARGSLL